MPGPETTEPATTPDQYAESLGISPTAERELKSWDDDRLKDFWMLRVNSIINREEEVRPYRSPSRDKDFENKVNLIIHDYLVQVQENPELLKITPYDLNKLDTASPSTGKIAQTADPVNLFNGDFLYSATDLHLDGAGMDFVFTRTYSQLSFYAGPLGFNWDHSYNLWLRVTDNGRLVRCSTGMLREDLYVRHEQHDYWVPPDGAPGILIENGGSFILRFPDGTRVIYQPHPTLQPSFHIVARIEDRFGNHLRFLYTDGLLAQVQVNHPGRVVDFQYDTLNRITAIRDFTGRVWRYDYDDLGNLAAVTLPATPQYPRGVTSGYEYTGALNGDTSLQHNLIAIIDPDGRCYLENEYGQAPNLLSYRRIVRQRQGGGEVLFEYEDVVEEFDLPYADHEQPAHQTLVTERDGRQVRFLFNRFGNVILREEYARVNGVPRRVATHFRYNRDGNLVGMITPLGVITQAFYGRDLYERRFPPDSGALPETDANLTPAARLRFHDLLAVVSREGYHDVNSLNLALGLWAGSIFPDVLQADDQDVIQKFTYEPEFAQLLTASDPRVTRSADPTFPEDSEYQRRLTRYTYAPGPGSQNLLLASIEAPTPTLPDGSTGAPVITRLAEYDGHGRVIRIIAPNGVETLNQYATAAGGVLEGFLMATTIDPAGFNIRRGLERDPLGRAVKTFRPPFFDFNDDRFFSTAEYDDLGQIVQATSTAPFSIRTRYAYTRAGNIQRAETDLKDPTHVLVGSFVTRNRFDEEFHLTALETGDGEGQAVKQGKAVFDQAGRACLTIGPSGRKFKTTFDERSLVAKTIEDYGGVHAVTRRLYDADGRVIKRIDARGAATRFSYDALGRQVDTEDAIGNRVIRHFDKLGNLLVECLFEKAGEDAFVLRHRRAFDYDELGRLIVAGANRFEQAAPVTAAQLGSAFRDSGPGELLLLLSFYDAAGDLVKQVDQDGREFVSEFDLLGRVIRKLDPFGNEMRFRYDKEGNLLRVDRQELTRDPVTNAVTAVRHFAHAFSYDELNRMVRETGPTGAMEYRYDSRGNRVEIVDALGNRIERSYDVFSRVIEHRQFFHRHQPGETPVPVRTAFSYDRDDQALSHTDALGRITRFQYDSAGRLIATVLPDGSADSSRHDRLGNVIEYRDYNGLIQDLEWDALNRNTALRIDPSGLPGATAFAGALDYRCTYDALGRILRAENDFAITRFIYNSLGHVLQEIASFTAATGLDPADEYVIRRRFAGSGAVTGITYPSGREIQYDRDLLDRVIRIAQVRKGDAFPGAPGLPDALTLAGIGYEGLQVKRIQRHNGISTTFRYDSGGRTAEIGHARGGQEVLTIQMLYDALGNMRQRIEVSEDHRSTETFRYDSLLRLFEASRSGTAALLDLTSIAPPAAPLPEVLPNLQAQIDALIVAPTPQETGGIAYDLVGNRVSSTLGGIQAFQTNALDQYTQVGPAALQYDQNGNLAEDADFRYRYDHNNQLAIMDRKAGTQETRFFFDYFGRRCLQADGTGSSLFLYDGHDLIEQYDQNQLTRSVVSNARQDDLLLSSNGGRDLTLLSDLIGSVRYLFDGAQKRNFYRYDAFGNLRASLASGDDNPFRFAGKRLLGDTGKYDFIYRTYDPSLGRFIQRDPKGTVDGPNRYTFVQNNPLVLTDPLGLESRPENAAPLAQRLGADLAYKNPPGFTLELPDNYENDKVRAYKERITNPNDRGVGIRSRLPGTKSATDDIRAANQGLRDAYEAGLPGGRRPAGTDIDHTVELQHINRRVRGVWSPGADTVRPQDHRVQDSRLNNSQGSRGRIVKERQIRNGAPYDTPAGGVARTRDINKFWNTEFYRTGMRYFGYYNMAGGTVASLDSLGDNIREGNWASAAIDTSAAAGGMLELGGILAKSSSLLNAGRFLGAPAAVAGSAVVGVRIGTNLYNNYVDHDEMIRYGEFWEEKTGSRFIGALAAADYAVKSAIIHAPEAAYDYVTENLTLDPDEIDWGRTFRPWRWF